MITFLFVYLAFTLFALNSLSGIYRNRCQPDPVDWSENATAVEDPFTYLCGNATGSMPCPVNYTCVADRGENPDQGYTNFDNFGYAALSVFRLILKDFWESLYNDTHRTLGFFPIFFFLTLIFINLLFNNLFASYIAIGAAKFFRQLNAIESKKTKVENSSTRSTTQAADIFPSENSELSSVEFNAVETQPTTSNDNDESEENENPSKLSKIWNLLVNLVWGWNCCQRSYCQKQLETFLFHRYFEWYINIVIAVTISIEIFIHNQVPMAIENGIFYFTLVIDILYFLEVILKIIAVTPKQFFANGWNRLDFFIALFGILIVSLREVGGAATPLRFLRALRYMKSWKKGSSVLKVNKVSIWMIFIVMISLAHFGTLSFRDYYVFDIPSRWNFISGFESFLVVFRAFAGEWVENLLPLVAFANHQWLVYIYFVIVIVSSYILLANAFLLLIHTILETDDIFDTDHHFNNEKSIGIMKRIVDCLRITKDTKIIIENGDQTGTNEENRTETNGVHDVNRENQQLANDNTNPSPCCWDWCSKRTSFQPLSTTERTSCWSTFRRRAFIWSSNNIWRGFITTIIVLSFIPYILPIPIVHTYTNYVITAIFIFEITLQIIGEGLKTYFGNCWTAFDFFITLIHLILNAFYGVNPLRILRLIVRLEDQKAVVTALLYRQALLVEAMTITSFVWLLFSIQGTHLFKLEDREICQTDSGEVVWEIITFNCTSQNLTAHRLPVNFDNVSNGFVALLQLATFKGWIGVWHNAEKIRIYHIEVAFFFMGFILMGAFVCLAIIVSSFIIKHNAHRKEIGGGYIEILMTVSQRKQLAIKRKQWFMTPEKSFSPNEAGYARLISRVVSHKLFDLFSIVLLLLNTIVLGIYSHSTNIEHWSHIILEYAFLPLIAGFVIEIGLQILVYRKAYFQKSWNIYNFVLIIGIILTHFIPDLQKYLVSPGLLVWLLTFRLVRWLKWIKRIALMVRVCLPAIGNVANFMAIVLFFFSVTCMQLYTHANPHEIHSFRNFFSANSILIEIAFFGAWDSVYKAMLAEGHLAALFIINYLIICFCIFITAGTVIFMENYHHLNEKLRLGIEEESFENYKKMWQIFDPDGTGTLTFDDLSDFLHYLDPPFQVEKPNDLKITAMQFPVNKDNKVKFSDVLQNIIYHLDKEKKVPKPILVEDEEKAPSPSRLVEIREKAAQLHKTRNWCCQKRKSFEENEELTSDQ